MKKQLIFILFVVVSIISFAQNSSVDFEIRNLGVIVDGYFKTVIINAKFDDANKFEFITLESTSVSKTSNTNYKVKANVFIKGKIKQITIAVKLNKLQNSYKITSNFKINRNDFNVGGGSFIMSKTVKLKVIHYQNI